MMCEQQGRRSWEAAIILSERRDKRAIESMKRMLTSKHPVLGQIVAEALAAYGNDHFDALLEALPNSTDLTQITILSGLERIHDQRAVAPLIAFLQAGHNSILTYTTIRTLGALGDQRAVDLIRTFVNHDDAHIAKHARMALQQLEAASKNLEE